MMKTAMQQLIEMLDNKHQEMISKDRLTSAEACKMLKDVVTEFLPIERQQLEDAFNSGGKISNYTTSMDLEHEYPTFNHYFKTKYNHE